VRSNFSLLTDFKHDGVLWFRLFLLFGRLSQFSIFNGKVDNRLLLLPNEQGSTSVYELRSCWKNEIY